jgi:L-arabinose 1- dehydrogenase
MKKLGIAVIGLGVISKFYIDAVNKSETSTLQGVCDLNEDLLAPFLEKGVFVTQDYKVLLDRDDVDAVIITAPNHLHYEMSKAALLAGKHVCCEKPLAIEVSHAAELNQLASRVRRVLLTGFHRRYNQNVLSFKESLRSSARPVFVTARYLEKIEEHCGPDAWYLRPEHCGGGCVIDNGSNVFDSLHDLFGALKVEDVRLVRNTDLSLEEQAFISLRSDSGLPIQVFLDWQYPRGEAKDITVITEQCEALSADLLGSFTEFKGSLWHEYAGILTDFLWAINADCFVDPAGLHVCELVQECYRMDKEKRLQSSYAKRPIDAAIVKPLHHKRVDRGMRLIEHESRCIGRGEIHELVTTDQVDAVPGDRIDRVGFLGFGEFKAGGVVERGDVVRLGGRRLGTVVGFDDCHYPNHYNILIAVGELLSATDLGLGVTNTIVFQPREDRV